MLYFTDLVNQGKRLRGVIHIPVQHNPPPVIILLHGFAGNRTEAHQLFRKFAEECIQRGIACARFDFAGCGESDGDFENITFASEVSDADAMLNYVLRLGCIDPKRCYLLGISMGGMVASVIAARRPGDVQKLCLWAPAVMLKSAIDRLIFPDCRKQTNGEKDYVDYLGNRIGTRFLEELKCLDLREALSYDKPTMILHGSRDEVVPVSEVVEYHQAIKDHTRIHIIERADHVFSSVRFERELFDETHTFFEDIVKREAEGTDSKDVLIIGKSMRDSTCWQ